MLFHNLLHNRQSETSSALLRRKEWFKDPVARRFIHSLPPIRNRDPRIGFWRLTVAICLGWQQLRRNYDRGVFLTRIDSVGNHVHENLPQLIGIPLAHN